MKKTLFLLLALMSVSTAVNAQLLRAEELEKYAKEKYGEKWVDAASNLGAQVTLDKNNAITYVHVIEAPGKTKDNLYVLLNYWFTATFNDANAVIKLNDKALGTIIAQGHVADIAQHAGGTSAYNVSISPVIKCDIKDERVRVTYTVPYYKVVRTIGGGWWKSHATLTLLAKQDLPTFGYNMIDPLKSWCWGSILFYPFKISRFS